MAASLEPLGGLAGGLKRLISAKPLRLLIHIKVDKALVEAGARRSSRPVLALRARPGPRVDLRAAGGMKLRA
jgi:hypothetical protein